MDHRHGPIPRAPLGEERRRLVIARRLLRNGLRLPRRWTISGAPAGAPGRRARRQRTGRRAGRGRRCCSGRRPGHRAPPRPRLPGPGHSRRAQGRPRQARPPSRGCRLRSPCDPLAGDRRLLARDSERSLEPFLGEAPARASVEVAQRDQHTACLPGGPTFPGAAPASASRAQTSGCGGASGCTTEGLDPKLCACTSSLAGTRTLDREGCGDAVRADPPCAEA